jgi:hypothetical protein
MTSSMIILLLVAIFGLGSLGFPAFDHTAQHPMTIETLKSAKPGSEDKVVGGTPVQPPFKYSEWLVAVQKQSFQFCAGSMVGKNLMVTAGRK